MHADLTESVKLGSSFLALLTSFVALIVALITAAQNPEIVAWIKKKTLLFL
jgi:hypothetical protein